MLDDIKYAINEQIKDGKVLDSLGLVIAKLEAADALMEAQADSAKEFLILNYQDNKSQLQRELIWNEKDYKFVYSSIWSDLLKIMNSCNLIHGTLEDRKNEFNTYSKIYLDHIKKYIDVNRCKADSYDSMEESSEYFRKVMRFSAENRKLKGNPYADYCFQKIVDFFR